jgi:hypothetical protein
MIDPIKREKVQSPIPQSPYLLETFIKNNITSKKIPYKNK